MLRKNKEKEKEKESRQSVLIDQSVIQRDWEDREFVEVNDISYSITECVVWELIVMLLMLDDTNPNHGNGRFFESI